jgi:phage terminase large subunit-like protein
MSQTPGSAEQLAASCYPGQRFDPPCPDCDWSPREGQLWPTEGARAVWWIQTFVICGEGDWYGKPIVLRADQKRSLYRWYEYCGGCGHWRYTHWVRTEATGGGKTTFMGGIGTLEVGGPPEISPVSPDVVMAANSWDQANKLFGAASVMCGGSGRKVRESPLRDYFEVYDSKIVRSDGRPGLIERVAAVAGTNEGGLPSTFMCDEVHELGESGETGRARMHVVIGKSTNKRQLRCEIPVYDAAGKLAGIREVQRGPGRIIDISTAGFDVDHSFFGDLYKHGKEVLKNPELDPRLLFECWEAPPGLNFEKREDRYKAVMAASPAAGILWNPTDRVNEWRNPKMPTHEWGRYYANRWEKIPEDSWLKANPTSWGNCQGTWEITGDEPTVLAVDMSLSRDSTAVDQIVKLHDGRIAVTAKIWFPGGGKVDHLEVYNHIKSTARELGDRFRGLVYDPRFFELPALLLEEEGFLVIQFDQTAVLMAPAVGETFTAIIDEVIVHDGDAEFTRQVLGAAKRMQERGFTLSKGKSKIRIDSTVAMCMGVHAITRLAPKVDVLNTMW